MYGLAGILVALPLLAAARAVYERAGTSAPEALTAEGLRAIPLGRGLGASAVARSATQAASGSGCSAQALVRIRAASSAWRTKTSSIVASMASFCQGVSAGSRRGLRTAVAARVHTARGACQAVPGITRPTPPRPRRTRRGRGRAAPPPPSQDAAAPAAPPLPYIGQFLLVERDGQVIHAVAFSVVGNQVVYITADGSRRSPAPHPEPRSATSTR